MEGLLGQIISEVGVNQEQAEGGLGAILSLAKGQLGPEVFSKIASHVTGAEGMANKFSQDDEPGLDMGDILGTATSALGVSAGTAGLAGVIGKLSSLNLDLGTLQKFVPIISTFLEGKGLGDIVQKLKSFL